MSQSLKPSGVDWIGDVPNQWEVRRLKDYFLLGMGETILTSDLDENGIYPVYSATEMDKYFGYKNTLKIKLKKSDLVIPARGNSIGFVKLVRVISGCTQTTMYLKSRGLINSKFVFYYLLGNRGNLFIFNDTAIPQITIDQISNNVVLSPPLSEQIAIADYLDKTTALIDRQRALLERKKALLQEHKKALIHEAVTKGLNPGVPMKPSGVDWIGEVPGHWNMRRLKDILYERGEKNIRDDGQAVTDNILSVMKDRGVINYRDKGNVGNKMSDDITGYKVVHKGDLVVNKMNVLIGSFGISPENGALSVVYLVLRNIVGHMPYFGCVFSDKGFQLSLRRIATGILEIREAVNMDLFWQEVIPFPPEAEQVDIAKHLVEIGHLISRQDQMLQKKLDLLAHLRSSVIHEAVTKGLPATASAC